MSVPPLRALAAQVLTKQLQALTPEQLQQYARGLYDLVNTHAASTQQLYAARAVREELLRRLLTGWKIAIIYNATNYKGERVTALLDDPGLTRNWMTSRGYYKRDPFFLERTHLALSRLRGIDVPLEQAEQVGRILLQAYASPTRRVMLTTGVVQGEVIDNQHAPSPQHTYKIYILGVNDYNLGLTEFRSVPPIIDRVSAEVDATPEILALWEMFQLMENHPEKMFEW